jgi:hypothetical protein
MGDSRTSETAKKLAILLPHLIRHNNEHAEELEKWIKSAEEDGCGIAAKEMKKAQSLMRKISDHLDSAAESIGADKPKMHDGHHDHHHDKHHDKNHDHSHHHHHTEAVKKDFR